MSYIVGEPLTLEVTFTDDDGNEIDPTTPVEVSIINPDGDKVVNKADATEIDSSTFEYEYTPETGSMHSYYFRGQDGNTELGSFDVIPINHYHLVQKLRKFLNDKAELNELELAEESTDEELYQAIEHAFDEINHDLVPAVTYSDINSVPSQHLLILGATLQVLASKGILSARNTLSYSDSGGITVNNQDEYGRYINYFNVLVNKYIRGVTSMKQSSNIDQAWGGVASEYSSLHNYS